MVAVIEEVNLSSKIYDGIVLIAKDLNDLTGNLESLQVPLKIQAEIDSSITEDCTCVRVNLPARRLIFSPTGTLNCDTDDVRKFSDAAVTGIKRAIKAGAKCPLLVVVPYRDFPQSQLVALLGALHALYVPLEIKEDVSSRANKVEKLGFLGDGKVVELAMALESGRTVARDIGGSDPERMAAPAVEKYIKEIFNGTSVNVDVISEERQLEEQYPLFSAVNRCAKGVERHKGRVIFLTYNGKGPIEKTLLLVGKGVTYDTGGADVKAGGVMAGMHRDKCGAAAVAGFLQVVGRLKPHNLKVIGALSLVRNSIGSECYVADEIITSRAGVRVRVCNTDAEGRMAMADVLCQMKEKALKEVDPHLMTIATLTGHCVLAYGEGYSAIMDNGPAKIDNVSTQVQSAGEEIAEPLEISTIRREDYDFHRGKSEYEDVMQSNNLPSTRTERGHQTPAAFLIMASGLDKHGKDSNQPLKYTHIDIAGGAGPFPGIPTGAPVLALTKTFIPYAF